MLRGGTWIRTLKGKSAQDCVPVFKQLVSELEHEAGRKVCMCELIMERENLGLNFKAI